MSELRAHSLTGLDGQNPLGFLAALGLLRILDEHARRGRLPKPKLSFVDEGQQVARIWSSLELEAIQGVILEDAAAQAESLALRLAYDDDGNLVEPSAPGATRDLKPSPASARAYLARLSGASRRDADLAAGLFSELVQDNNGNTKPTALHFTAGQQTFLSMVEELRKGISVSDLQEALIGPWKNLSALPSLSWDSSATRNYALRASNPSKEKRGSVAGANWLAVHGLAFFPVHPRRGRLRTAGVAGGWKDSVFTWPLWAVPVEVRTVMALLRCNVSHWTMRERTAAGIVLVLRAGILRSDQGGYGSFTPSTVVADG
jgi:hypothetical protein